MSAEVTLHWHGVDVTNAEDGVAGLTQDAVPVVGRFVYRFRVDDAGTYWYHSHQRSSEQIPGGLFGVLIVDPKDMRTGLPTHEVIAALHTYGDLRTINGGTGPRHVDLPAGSLVRVRVINTDSVVAGLAVSGAAYRLVAQHTTIRPSTQPLGLARTIKTLGDDMEQSPMSPYDSGLLDAGDGNLIYWETCGNPDGPPVLVVHGGPGAGCSTGMRRAVNPERYRLILFDQRNCGRSRPHASDPAVDLSHNTTTHLVHDMERLREHLGIRSWMLFGGSWGVTLSLAYAQRHPERVTGMLLVSVATGRRSEVDWLYRGVGRVFPEAWARFRDHAGTEHQLPTDSEPPVEELLLAYSRLMVNPDVDVRMRAATEWLSWEDTVISRESNGRPGQYSDRADDAKLAFVRICAHYFANGCFLDEGILIRGADKLAGIPGVLVHGRGDLGGPAVIAWELAHAWPGVELVIVEDSGHTGSAAMRAAINAAADRLFALRPGLGLRRR